jgi:hypothetical protein
MGRVLVTSAVTFALIAAPALAARSVDPKHAAQHLSGILTAWGVAGFGGVVAIIGVVLLAGRKSAELVRFALMAVIVGGMIFATGTVIAIIRGIWGAV